MLSVNLRQRGKTYQIDYRNPNGRRRRLSVGTSHRHAQRIVIRITDWLLDGKDPEREMERATRAEQARAVTVRAFFPTFMDRHGSRQSLRTQGTYRERFQQFCRYPGIIDTPIGNINKAVVIDYCQLRISQDGISAATANREASLLRNMLNRAVEWEILERNSLDNYRLLKEADKREVLVSPAQIQRLLDLLKQPMADIAEFAVYTGLRKENILSLKIEQVTLYDLEPGGEIQLVVKGGKRRTKPLGEKAAEIIKRNIGTRHTGHVFINTRSGTRYMSINKVFDRAVIKAGLKVDGSKLRFHDLRHVTASWLSQKGVSLDIIRVLLDHEDRDTTDRYVSHDLRAHGELLNLLPAIRKEA